MNNLLEKLRETLNMPVNYLHFFFSRFPERRSPFLTMGLVTILSLLIWIISELKIMGIVCAISAVVTILIFSFPAFLCAPKDNKQIPKETAYNNLLTNMTSAVLPAEVIKDISEKMGALKAEIEELKEATPPEDYSVDVIQEWLQSIRNAPDEKAVHLLIERIDAIRVDDKTDLNISTTLKPVLEIFYGS